MDGFLSSPKTPLICRPALRSPPASLPCATAFRTIGDPNLLLKWQPAKVHVAKGRDLGYTLGQWQLFDKTKPGSPVIATGKYLTVWEKQKDKSWKAVADIGNQDPPTDSKP
jgi:ketosteroid isomerase-like protein